MFHRLSVIFKTSLYSSPSSQKKQDTDKPSKTKMGFIQKKNKKKHIFLVSPATVNS